MSPKEQQEVETLAQGAQKFTFRSGGGLITLSKNYCGDCGIDEVCSQAGRIAATCSPIRMLAGYIAAQVVLADDQTPAMVGVKQKLCTEFGDGVRRSTAEPVLQADAIALLAQLAKETSSSECQTRRVQSLLELLEQTKLELRQNEADKIGGLAVAGTITTTCGIKEDQGCTEVRAALRLTGSVLGSVRGSMLGSVRDTPKTDTPTWQRAIQSDMERRKEAGKAGTGPNVSLGVAANGLTFHKMQAKKTKDERS